MPRLMDDFSILCHRILRITQNGDYSNGNTAEGIDEGQTLAWRAITECEEKLKLLDAQIAALTLDDKGLVEEIAQTTYEYHMKEVKLARPNAVLDWGIFSTDPRYDENSNTYYDFAKSLLPLIAAHDVQARERERERIINIIYKWLNGGQKDGRTLTNAVFIDKLNYGTKEDIRQVLKGRE